MSVEFWFDFASTYSYPAAMTIEDRATAKGIKVCWRPFLLGPIFAKQGWDDSPFNMYPAKGRYMWQDMARLCAAEGLPFVRPPMFPQRSVLAARVALIGLSRGWGEAFCRAIFHAQFATGASIDDSAVVAHAVKTAGGDGDQALKDALSPANKLVLRQNVDEATDKGVFGAPSFWADDTLFWGFDRLEAALDHAARSEP